MNTVGAGEVFANKPPAREKIKALLADEEITVSLPRVVGSFAFKGYDADTPEISEVVLRESYNDDPAVVLVVLLDFMNAAVESNASEEYLEGLLRLTGLKPERARLRFDISMGTINLIENDKSNLEAQPAGQPLNDIETAFF